MSTFKVTNESISHVLPHPNADRLEIIKLDGKLFQCCATKGKYKVGDSVVYFPVDSVLTPKLIDFFGIGNFLAGKNKNRLKTVRLRGETSQGFVCALMDIHDYFMKVEGYIPVEWNDITVGYDLTTLLQVVKYEPPEVPCFTGNLVRHPEGITTYDIEGTGHYPKVLDFMMPMNVYISEKLEGSNHYSVLNNDGFIVGQRKHQIKPIEGKTHDWFKTAQKYKHEEKLREIKRDLGADSVSLRSELCGPGWQKNIYGFKELMLFTFDILVDRVYLNPSDFLAICKKYEIITPPTIAYDVVLKDFLNGMTIEQASHGQSLIPHELYENLREGFVVKPMVEQNTDLFPDGGRLIIKQRDPIYLDITGF
jgi:RNA ligase (TIGR02306 family)